MTPGTAPGISIVIPTHNDGPGSCRAPHEKRSMIAECLESIRMTLTADPTETEILIGDDASTDDTRAQIAAVIDRWRAAGITERRPVRVLHATQRRGPAAMVNDLIALAAGEIVVRLDADVALISTNWAQRVLAHFQKLPGAGILGGVQMGDDDRVWSFGDSLFNAGGIPGYQHLHRGEPCPPPGLVERVDYNMMCFAAFPRELWQFVGGFDPQLGRYEEVEFNLCVATSGHRWSDGGRSIHVTSDIVYEHRQRLRHQRDGTWDDATAIDAARERIEAKWGFDWREADPEAALARWGATALCWKLRGRQKGREARGKTKIRNSKPETRNPKGKSHAPRK